MQFLTQGLLNGTIGYLSYFACLNMEKLNPLKQCADKGPGSQMNFYYDVICFLLQIVLIWMAMSI
jgi:hypothetical protein